MHFSKAWSLERARWDRHRNCGGLVVEKCLCIRIDVKISTVVYHISSYMISSHINIISKDFVHQGLSVSLLLLFFGAHPSINLCYPCLQSTLLFSLWWRISTSYKAHRFNSCCCFFPHHASCKLLFSQIIDSNILQRYRSWSLINSFAPCLWSKLHLSVRI